jgi:hypothetical protein
MAKNFFFLPGIVFFWVNNPREVNEFASTTVVLAVVLPLRTLCIGDFLQVFWRSGI